MLFQMNTKDCRDKKGEDFCSGKNCEKEKIQKQCQKTCGLCTITTTAPSITTKSTTMAQNTTHAVSYIRWFLDLERNI